MKLSDVLLENFGDFRRALINAYEERWNANTMTAATMADNDIRRFKEARQRNIIPKNKADISDWIRRIRRDPSELIYFRLMLDTAEEEIEARNRGKENDTFHYRDSELTIVEPGSHESACKYGYQTMWCTSMRDDASHYYHYTSGSGRLFYLIFDEVKVAISYYGHNEFDIWNERDETETPNWLMEVFDHHGIEIGDVIDNVRDRELRSILEQVEINS